MIPAVAEEQGGSQQRRALEHVRRTIYITPVTLRCNPTILFGNGQIEKAPEMRKHTVFIRCQHHLSISPGVSQSACPWRVSKQVMGDVGTVLRLVRNDFPVIRRGITLLFTEDITPLTDTTYPTIDDTTQTWQRTQDMCTHTSQGPWSYTTSLTCPGQK